MCLTVSISKPLLFFYCVFILFIYFSILSCLNLFVCFGDLFVGDENVAANAEGMHFSVSWRLSLHLFLSRLWWTYFKSAIMYLWGKIITEFVCVCMHFFCWSSDLKAKGITEMLNLQSDDIGIYLFLSFLRSLWGGLNLYCLIHSENFFEESGGFNYKCYDIQVYLMCKSHRSSMEGVVLVFGSQSLYLRVNVCIACQGLYLRCTCESMFVFWSQYLYFGDNVLCCYIGVNVAILETMLLYWSQCSYFGVNVSMLESWSQLIVFC